jgi:hypothetical protein
MLEKKSETANRPAPQQSLEKKRKYMRQQPRVPNLSADCCISAMKFVN